MAVVMDTRTDYVHTHVVNYEPAYQVLEDVTARWMADQEQPIADYRDELAEVVYHDWPEMGLSYADLVDCDFAVMIQWEAEHAD